ncbi:MAG TPA: DNA-3-methyladenine glycosylase [Terracidiphilus sp.]|nr:DNA-3-methyladenine glycosylase [Terracidiphilus sp.]
MEKIAELKSAAAARSLPGRLLPRAFFHHSPDWVAPRLLGKLLVHTPRAGRVLAGRIVEAEAYLGPHNHPPDPAAHSHRGPTPRNRVLFGAAAHAYVYSIYGQYFCMNVSCEPDGFAGCVLLRALEPVLGLDRMAANRGLPSGSPPWQLTSGPGRLSQALGLTRPRHNGLDLLDPDSPLQLRGDNFAPAQVLVTPRIGIRHAVDRPLRFAVPGHPCVSGPRSMSPAKFIRLSHLSS